MSTGLRRYRAPLAVALVLLWPQPAGAYTAAGDRSFPATILLPQSAPADELYLTPQSQPVPGGQATNLSLTFDKTLTERLGIQFEDGYNWIERNRASTLTGWQNLETTVKYLAVRDPPHETLVSLGFDREWGGTGAVRIGASPKGATTPTVYFAKGLGDLDIGYLRPLAITGSVGYQFADAPPRPDNLVTGVAVEYSIPYLQSKVEAFALPEPLRGMVPLVETFVVTPTRNRGGNRTAAVIGPGVSYSGGAWEIAIEALVPASRAAGTGVGITAQLHLSLDYLFPDSLGRPLFSPR